jgi:hypothetical protein
LNKTLDRIPPLYYTYNMKQVTQKYEIKKVVDRDVDKMLYCDMIDITELKFRGGYYNGRA